MADVGLDGAKMVGEGVARSLAGLGHEIGDVDAGSFGFGDGAQWVHVLPRVGCIHAVQERLGRAGSLSTELRLHPEVAAPIPRCHNLNSS